MCYEEGHTAPFGNPVQFLFPGVDVFLLHKDKEQEILRQCVRELNISLLWILIGNPERKDCAHTVRLRFKGIGIKGGCIVFDVEMMKHFQVVVHAGAAETHGTPFFQVPVDFDGLPPKNRFRTKRIVVMVQAVDDDFEIMVPQVLAQCSGNLIIPGNKAKGRPKPKMFFDFSQ